MKEDAFLNAIIMACVIGIFLSFFMILAKDRIVKPEYFTELYYKKPAELPRHLEVNKSYNFSFTLVNHERGITNYIYYLMSDVKNITSNVTLLPGESATFRVDVRPEGRLWHVNSYINYSLYSSLDVVRGFFGIPANISLNLNSTYRPLSFNLPGFGEIYHVNLSVDSLKEKPFSWSEEYRQMNNDSKSYRNFSMVFYSEGERVLVNSTRLEESSHTMPDRFTVMLYGRPNVIYFKYDVG